MLHYHPKTYRNLRRRVRREQASDVRRAVYGIPTVLFAAICLYVISLLAEGCTMVSGSTPSGYKISAISFFWDRSCRVTLPTTSGTLTLESDTNPNIEGVAEVAAMATEAAVRAMKPTP